MTSTKEEAKELIKSIQLAKTSILTPKVKSFIEFAISNCFHKLKNFDQASKRLLKANDNKSTAHPSNADELQEAIANNLSHLKPEERIITNTNCGKNRIFIAGMPVSGSTLLETILSINPKIKGLGESRSLAKAILNIQKQPGNKLDQQKLDDLYSQLEPISNTQLTHTTDK